MKLIALLIMSLIAASHTYADYVDPTAKTNVNVQTDLFEKSVDDVAAFQRQIESGKDGTIGGLQDPAKGLEFISGKSKSEIESGVAGLSSIKANELSDKGREVLVRENIIEEIYIDETKPLFIQHQRDAQKIADASGALISRLTDLLKDIGVDCKTAKGNKEVEPVYYIDIKREQTRDTKYNRTMCEELRNRYNCNDTLTVKCTKTGLRYGEWQHKTIRLGGHALHHEKPNWGYAIFWKRKRWGWHITPYHPKRGIFGYGEKQVDSMWRNNPSAIIADARIYLANKLGVKLEQIREDIGFPASGRGVDDYHTIDPVGYRWRVAWHEYEFTYYYRDAYPICEVWSEDWNEVCRLQ